MFAAAPSSMHLATETMTVAAWSELHSPAGTVNVLSWLVEGPGDVVAYMEGAAKDQSKCVSRISCSSFRLSLFLDAVRPEDHLPRR
jgi:hypothetical protein